MAGLYLRGNTYYAMYYIGNRKHRKSLDTSDPKVAKARLRKLEESLDQGSDTPFPTKTAIPVVLEAFIQHMFSRRDARSVNRDLSPLRMMFGPVSASLQVKNKGIVKKRGESAARKGRAVTAVQPLEAVCFEALTARQLSAWLSDYALRNSSEPKTMNRYREVLQKLFKWAIDTYGVKFPGDGNPAARIQRWKEGAPVIVFLTMEEIDAQLRGLAGNRQLQCMVAVYIYAGLRREEGLWLQGRDVDLEAGFIRIRAKTADDGRSWEPKTGTNRIVPISRQLRPYLESYGRDCADGDWYFPAPKGGWWDPDNFSGRALAPANKKLGFTWGCDEFRHTFGTHLAMRGISLYKISKMMGNSPEICRRHYAALIPESLIDCVDFTTDVELAPAVQSSDEDPADNSTPQLRLVVNM